jgi:cell division protein FtsW (lipid II flippase)
MRISQPLRRLLPASTSASLLRLAALFLGLYALALTLSPAVRDRSFDGLSELRWMHWLGVIVWWVGFFWLDQRARRELPNRDPFIVPLAGLLSGWGMLTIWRLTTDYGLRQTVWIGLSVIVFIGALRYKERVLAVLRRYKYVWLLAGFLLTALTFLFGTNPSGIGPKLWLGCCGFYFQPSEPLKLLLIVFLAGYLADRQPLMSGLLPLVAPTVVMTGAALLLLMVQRDLGTAWVFIFIYTVLIYIAAGRRRVLLASLIILIVALIAGYELVDLVHQRIDIWVSPWTDPSGSGYQVIQGLMAMASGGIFGRGPGLGAPEHVPVHHSDFIYTSIVEETGLVGAVALLLIITLLSLRALRISLNARDAYQRYLAIGICAYLACQSLLIIGGNIRMLPLTGVTLPFVSYGGSSMLTSFAALLLLCLISNDAVHRSAPLLRARPTLLIAGGLLAAFGIAAVISGWWGIVRGPDLLTRVDNARRAMSDSYVLRGALLDRNGHLLNVTTGETGDYERGYLYPELGNVLGYSHPNFGQAGLENGLDPILRGEQYQPWLSLWLNHVLYGLPSPGLDVQLTLDIELELQAAELLDEQAGAAVVLDAENGEVLAMASQPGFEPNDLAEEWETLLNSSQSELVNRAAQGAYPPGAALGPFLLASARSAGALPIAPSNLNYVINSTELKCQREPRDSGDWNQIVAAGCPAGLAELGIALGGERLLTLFNDLGFYQAPYLPLNIHSQTAPGSLTRPGDAATGQGGLLISPLQMALAISALSNYGQVPSPSIVLNVEQVSSDWLDLEDAGIAKEAISGTFAQNIAQGMAVDELPIWEYVAQAYGSNGQTYTWYLAGTIANESDEIPSRVVVVLLENTNPARAKAIGRELISAAIEE